MLWKQELTVSATVSMSTGTDITVVSLVAGGTVVAGVVLAAADRGAAVATRVSRGTSADVAIRTFLARATILARIRRTLITSVVTVLAGEAVWTLTQVGVHEIHTACT